MGNLAEESKKTYLTWKGPFLVKIVTEKTVLEKRSCACSTKLYKSRHFVLSSSEFQVLFFTNQKFSSNTELEERECLTMR